MARLGPDERMSESLVGRVLGSYRIERELGAGGMGAVYVGKHVRTGRTYAVKVLLPEHARRRDALRRFRREAEALSALGHAHIVAIHDYDESADGHFFLAMDLLEGEDLAHRLERVHRLPWPEAVVLLDAIASAIEAAHGLGMVHRDLKPSNVFLARTPGAAGERPVLLDFGLARALEDDDGQSRVTATGTVLGTPGYMSPEQAQGQPLDPRSDVWALGVVLFEACAGRPPFVAPTIASTFVQILTAPTPTLASLGLAVPPALEEILARALEKSPGARFADVAALRRALAPLVAQAPRGPLFFGGAAGGARDHAVSLAPTLESGPSAAPRAGGGVSGMEPTLALGAAAPASVPGTVAMATGPAPVAGGARPLVWLAAGLGAAALGTLAAVAVVLAFFEARPAPVALVPTPLEAPPVALDLPPAGSPIAIAPAPAAPPAAPAAPAAPAPEVAPPLAEAPADAPPRAERGTGRAARAATSREAGDPVPEASARREGSDPPSAEPAADPGAVAPPSGGPPPALIRATDLMGEGDFAGCLRELEHAGTSAPILGARMSCARSAGDHAALEETCELLHQHHPRHGYTRTCDTLLGVTP